MTGSGGTGLETGRQVCAILVSYHPDPELPRRVTRILGQVGALVIVDNGSGDEARAMLARIAADPRVSLVLNPANLGVARGLNLGVEQARTSGFAWVLLLDQDSELQDGMLRAIIEVRAAYPEPSRVAVIGASYGEETRPARKPWAAWEEVESVITSGSLIPLALHAAIGPFREELFIDYVDIDYCYRARSKGYRVLRTTQPLMSHTIGAPTEHTVLGVTKWTTNHSPDRRYYIARNDTVMLREYGGYPFGSWALKSLGRRLRTCRRIALYERSKARKIAAVAAGWWDGVCGRLGPRKSAAGR
ncbi:MAG: glycosyltransferase family 2 protein [Steroidobacteraceae bacterium]